MVIYNSGEKPGKGVYVCTKCGYKVDLKDSKGELPICPKCKATTYIKE